MAFRRIVFAVLFFLIVFCMAPGARCFADTIYVNLITGEYASAPVPFHWDEFTPPSEWERPIQTIPPGNWEKVVVTISGNIPSTEYYDGRWWGHILGDFYALPSGSQVSFSWAQGYHSDQFTLNLEPGDTVYSVYGKADYLVYPGIPNGIEYTIESVALIGTPAANLPPQTPPASLTEDLIAANDHSKNCTEPVVPETNPPPNDGQDKFKLTAYQNNNKIDVADPVNIPSGNFTLLESDLSLKSRLPLSIDRTYNSIDTSVSPFGRGWNALPFSRLEIASSTIVFVNSNGTRVIFQRVDDEYKSSEGVQLTLSLASDTGFWSVSQPSGSTWTFDAAGKIIRIEQAYYGHDVLDALTFNYDQAGKLYQVSNPAGQWLRFTYNPSKLVTAITDSTSRSVQYTYDGQYNLTSFTDTLGRTTDYSYDADGYMNRIVEPGNRVRTIEYADFRVSSITSPTGDVSRFTWNLNDREVELVAPNGTKYTYQFTNTWKLQNYTVTGANGEAFTKTYVATGTVFTEVTNSLGNTSAYSYYPNGHLGSFTDPLGSVTSYEWHPVIRKLTKKENPLARTWNYRWCSRGNLISETDPAGSVTSYTYDIYNNRISKIDPLGRVTRWIYDSTGNYLVQGIDAEGGISSFSYDIRGNLLSLSDPLGRTTQFQYDLLNRLTKTVSPDGRYVEVEYNEAGKVAVSRDNLGRETHCSYDLADRLTTLTRPDGTTFNYAYNASGQKISETDSLGRITRFEYSPIGLLTKTIYADNSVETFSYDTESRLVSKTNELGQTANFEYDPMGCLLAMIDPTGARWESQYDAAGRKLADKDPLNRVTAYQVDNLDRITKVIRPDNSFVTNSFDAVGNLLSTVDALGNSWSWVYDKLNRQVKGIQPNGASSTTAFDAAGQVIAETDALNRTTRYSFDNGGRRTATTDALNNVWQNFYDRAGRLTAVKDPMGAISSMSYDIMDRVSSQFDPLGNVTSYESDNVGRRIAKTDALGRRSITAYDLRDRVTSEVDPEGHTVSFGYNLAGQRVALTDGANRTWRWEYDLLGRVTSEIDPLGNINRYGFDNVGNRTTWTNATNQTTNYTFDTMNRLSQVNYSDGSLATMAYDLEGRELVRSGQSGVTTKTYDAVGNLNSESFSLVGAGLYNSSKIWQYQFDFAGNRIRATDPEGGIFTYQYSALNQLTVLDPPGRNDEVSISYDAAGRLISESKPNIFTENIFDPASRLLSTTHAKSKGQKPVLVSRQYTYNVVGNRTAQTDEDGKTTFYEFNGADWLTKAGYPDGSQVVWGYNGAGDRVSETIGTAASILYSYDSAGRMTARGADSFVYDNNGNLVQALENGMETRNTWNTQNRLTQVEKVTTSGNFVENYGYAPEDWRRIKRTANGKTIFTVFDNADEALEYEIVNVTKGPSAPSVGLELTRQFISGPGNDDMKFSVKGRRIYGMLADALGSVIGLTTPSGRIIAKVPYDAWGVFLQAPDGTTTTTTAASLADFEAYVDRIEASRSLGGTTATYDPYATGRRYAAELSPHLYTMRRFEPLTKNWFNRNRFYNPRHGRFLSVDPIGFLAGQNRFSYCGNNSLRWTDRWGLCHKAKFEQGYFQDDQAETVSRLTFENAGVPLNSTPYYPPEFRNSPAGKTAFYAGAITTAYFGGRGVKATMDLWDAYQFWKKTSESQGQPLLLPSPLTASENLGGHTIARHVGRTDADLAARLASQRGIRAASTFLNQAEAEAAVANALAANAEEVASWMASGANGRLPLNIPFSGGRVLQRGASVSTPGTGARIVLEGNGRGGYNILTSYPMP